MGIYLEIRTERPCSTFTSPAFGQCLYSEWHYLLYTSESCLRAQQLQLGDCGSWTNNLLLNSSAPWPLIYHILKLIDAHNWLLWSKSKTGTDRWILLHCLRAMNAFKPAISFWTLSSCVTPKIIYIFVLVRNFSQASDQQFNSLTTKQPLLPL